MPITIPTLSIDKNATCTIIEGADSVTAGYTAYLNDESRTQAKTPDRLYLPKTVDELAFAVRDAARRGGGITVSGARTGIAGGAVSRSANLISTDRMQDDPVIAENTEPDTGFAGTAICLAGNTLADLRDRLAETGLRYPVDPTEMTASVGGTISTNASGARTLRYGPTRSWVQSIVVVLANGDCLEARREQYIADDGRFDIECSDGTILSLAIDTVPIPGTKHNAGYHLTVPADFIDLFIGSEGTLGIVAKATLGLVAAPAMRLGTTLFLPNTDPVPPVRGLLELEPVALEYLDDRSLDLLRDARERKIDGGAVPPLPEQALGAIYVEFNLSGEDELESTYEKLETIMTEFGIDPEASWAGFEESEIEEMKHFRHALPERVNSIVSERKQSLPELTKIGTDMAVPIEKLSDMIDSYRTEIEATGIDFCIFGHIGNGHLHVNMIPKTLDELTRARELYVSFAERAVAYGGSVAAEHGLGNLKRKFLALQYESSAIETMRSVKRTLDPDLILNPGVIFPDS